MICKLRGSVDELSGNRLTLDVSGVGYEVICSSACLAKLIPGQSISLVVYQDVKEDSLRLYGFEDEMERQVFLLLLKVKGVGTKTAADIISRVDKRELLRALGAGDVAKLQAMRGIGKKTAERLVVELKDQVAEFVMERQSSHLIIEREVSEPVNDALEALQALGFARRDAERAIVEVTKAGLGKTSADIVKQALRFV